ncbi:MAG TPA: hypothetical protein VFZ49_01885 [Pyrinomonadaceae bacterium]
MRLIKALANPDLANARTDLDEGTPDDVVARAEQYLEVIDRHLVQLRTLKGVPKPSFAAQSQFARTLIEETRLAVRTEIEHTTDERNRIEELLASLKMVSGWAAAQAFNEQNYQNVCDWELIGTHVRSISAGADLDIPSAVSEASRLRREAFFLVRRAA